MITVHSLQIVTFTPRTDGSVKSHRGTKNHTTPIPTADTTNTTTGRVVLTSLSKTLTHLSGLEGKAALPV